MNLICYTRPIQVGLQVTVLQYLSFAGVCVCVSLQEVNATPVRFISDLLAEDSWSHIFMDTLAPRGFVKVRADKGRKREIVVCGLV